MQTHKYHVISPKKPSQPLTILQLLKERNALLSKKPNMSYFTDDHILNKTQKASDAKEKEISQNFFTMISSH